MAQDSKSPAVPVAELEYEHSPLEDAVIRYRKQLILVGALAVFGTIGYFGNKLWKESRHEKAGLAFSRAQTVGEYRAVAEAHSGQIAAGDALLQAALILARDGKGKEALPELEKMLAAYPQHPLADLAKFRLADIRLQEGATQEAFASFQEVANLPDSPYAALALLRMGDIRWGEGKTEEASGIYQQMITRHGGDRLFSIAEARQKEVKIAPPVLVDYVPEAPPPVVPIPGQPGGNMAPPSASALEGGIATPGLLDSDPGSPAGESLLPPPAIPAPSVPVPVPPVPVVPPADALPAGN